MQPERWYVTLRSEKTFEGRTMNNLVLRFWRDETGATAIEYGLIAAGISIAIIAAVNGLGTNLSGVFTSVNNSLK